MKIKMTMSWSNACPLAVAEGEISEIGQGTGSMKDILYGRNYATEKQ